MKGPLTMSEKERLRKAQFAMVLEGRKTLMEACVALGLCYRQGKRSYARYRAQGDEGLVHRGRGRPSNRASAPGLRRKALARYRARYGPLGFGPTLAAEKLVEEGLAVDHETLRRWLLEEGLWQGRRKQARHRSRREPRDCFGQLVQIDGSHHRWFGPEGPQCCLMALVDDATGTVLARMDGEETTEAAMRILWSWIQRYGIPQAVYCDRKSVYVTRREPTLEEQLAGETPLTAFGKACQKLGIEIIQAHSPQAKGRVERKHGVYQDRFVKELALRRITTLGAANAALENGFTDGLNQRFARPPAKDENAHRPMPRDLDLADVFCWEETRKLANDWTIRHNNQVYQILKDNAPLPRPKQTIVVRVRLDGTTRLFHRGAPIHFRVLTQRELHQKGRDAKKPQSAPKPKAMPRSAKPKPKPKRSANCSRLLAKRE